MPDFNYTLGYQDASLDATFTDTTGTPYVNGQGVELWNNPSLSAQSKVDTTEITNTSIDITLTYEAEIQVVGLCNHTLAEYAANIYFRCYSDAGRTQLTYTSPIVNVGGYFHAIKNHTNCITFDAPIVGRYWRLYISQNSPMTGVGIGRIFMGKLLNADGAMDYGMAMGADTSGSIIETTSSGVDIPLQSIYKRTASFSHSLADDTIGLNYQQFTMATQTDNSVLFQMDRDNHNLGVNTYLARLNKINPLTVTNFNANKFTISLLESI